MEKQENKLTVHMSESPLLNLLELLILLVGILSFFISEGKTKELVLILWILLSTLYVLGSCVIGNRSREGKLSRMRRPDEKRRRVFYAMNFVPIFASLFGLYASLAYQNIFSNLSSDSVRKFVEVMEQYQIQTIVICILGWLVMHVGYAHIYEQIDVQSGYTALRFPQTEVPCGMDYLYLGVTMGLSFATSDVEINTTRGRRIAAGQSVLSFIYNTVVIAIVVKLITGE